MRKIITFILALLVLTGCSQSSDYSGNYGIAVRDGYSYLIVSWEYPDEKNYDINTSLIDVSNFGKYIDETIEHRGKGLEIQKIEGAFGFTKRFVKIEPLYIHEQDVKKASRKKIQMSIKDDEGNVYDVELKYSGDIKYVE